MLLVPIVQRGTVLVLSVVSQMRSKEPKVSEPTCTGPFSDARDCPVHSKDLPKPLTSEDLKAAFTSGARQQREALGDWAHDEHGSDLERDIRTQPLVEWKP